MAYKVAENNCTKSGGSTKRDDGSKEHTVSYDIWISDGEITKVEEQSEHSNDEYDLLQEQKQAVASYSNYDEWPKSPKQNCVFEPSYISNLVNVTHRYGRVLCRQLIEEEKWPITKLDPPGDNTSFEFDTYVVALERYWGDADEYDYSTYKYRSAEKLTNEPIWIV